MTEIEWEDERPTHIHITCATQRENPIQGENPTQRENPSHFHTSQKIRKLREFKVREICEEQDETNQLSQDQFIFVPCERDNELYFGSVIVPNNFIDYVINKDGLAYIRSIQSIKSVELTTNNKGEREVQIRGSVQGVVDSALQRIIKSMNSFHGHTRVRVV